VATLAQQPTTVKPLGGKTTGQVLVVEVHARRHAPGIAVSWIAENRLARHAREGSSAGSTLARLLGCER
jgi:hypothetical protein